MELDRFESKEKALISSNIKTKEGILKDYYFYRFRKREYNTGDYHKAMSIYLDFLLQHDRLLNAASIWMDSWPLIYNTNLLTRIDDLKVGNSFSEISYL